MNALLKSLIMFLYPAQCRYCGENLDPSDGHYICKLCWDQAEVIERPYCDKCGYPLSKAAALPERIPSCTECPQALEKLEQKELGADAPRKDARYRKARSIAVYDSAVGEAVKLLKYHGKNVMAEPLANLMINAMPGLFNREDYDFIIPVPIHKKKHRERGYNQMELIGRKLSDAMGIPLDTRNFIKSVDSKPQAGLSSDIDRSENVRGTFDVPDPSRLAMKRILLIDDVMTTGATANECARTLVRKGKVKYVDVFTLTRVVKENS